MTQFVIRLVLGVFVGSSVTAFGAGIFGTGALKGWSVTKEGEEVCSDPTVDADAKEIQCE
jgi:hypothetical protein